MSDPFRQIALDRVKGKSDSTREVGMLLKASNWGFRELAAI